MKALEGEPQHRICRLYQYNSYFQDIIDLSPKRDLKIKDIDSIQLLLDGTSEE